MTSSGEPQELFEDETLEQALRQLTLFGHSGLPVISEDREHVEGWITSQLILQALAPTIDSSPDAIQHGATVADVGFDHPRDEAHRPTNPLHGYEVLEIGVDADARAHAVLRAGERVTLLSPTTSARTGEQTGPAEPATTGARRFEVDGS